MCSESSKHVYFIRLKVQKLVTICEITLSKVALVTITTFMGVFLINNSVLMLCLSSYLWVLRSYCTFGPVSSCLQKGHSAMDCTNRRRYIGDGGNKVEPP